MFKINFQCFYIYKNIPVANLPYIEELKEHRVQKMYNIINKHNNPLVQSVGHFNQQRAKHRNKFQGVPPAVTGDDTRVG